MAARADDARWRPSCHLTVRRGFLNDPNGLIEIDGVHHAFFQHNPHEAVHGPMHWGHAVSDDLTSWRELPVALYPDALGQCFSGSAVASADGGVALFYTAHLERDGADPLQTQCLVRADRELTRFEREPANPVLGNHEALADYRDPKVFRHEPSDAWVMVITQGRHVGVYRSVDLVSWVFASEFGHDLGAPGDGAWECPDLVELPLAGGGSRWALIVGVWSGAPGGGSGTQYFLGDFDGHRYRRDVTAPEVLWLDHGRDCYAAQSFAGRAGLAPRILAWCGNWQYANDTPTRGFRGAFTLPRDLDLVHTPLGPRLRQRVPAAVRDAFPSLDADGSPPGPVYRVSRQVVLAPGERFEIRLFGETVPAFTIERPGTDRPWRLALHRDAALGDETVLDHFRSAGAVDLAGPAGEALELELFADHGIVELFLGGGVDVATMSFYPADPAGAVVFGTTARSLFAGPDE